MSVVAVGWALLVVVMVMMANVLAAYLLANKMTRARRVRVTGSPGDMRLDHEDVAFATADDLVLRGWRLESPGARATVVLVHDAAGNRSDPAIGLLELQCDYLRSGFNVLSFDLRGRGESSGRRDHFGAAELEDVLAAVAYVQRRTDLPIVLHGFGTGASLALTAAERQGAIAVVIADSPVASMRDYMRDRHARVPAYLFRLAMLFARWCFAADIDALAPVRSMPYLVETDVLFVHCEDNPEVPIEHTLNIAAASLNGADEIWSRSSGGHCGAYAANPSAYVHRCLEFINRSVPARLPAARAV